MKIEHNKKTSTLYDPTENTLTTIERDIVYLHVDGDYVAQIPLVQLKKLIWVHDVHEEGK
jgi:hypothetical protein